MSAAEPVALVDQPVADELPDRLRPRPAVLQQRDGDDGEEDEEEAGTVPAELRDMTLKDLLVRMNDRKTAGVPMPSTVKRNEDRKKKRLEARKKRANPDANDADADAPAPDPDGTGEPAAKRTDIGVGAAEPAAEPEAELPDPVVVAPKVTIDEDGNIVIDQASLVISASDIPVTDPDSVPVVTVDSNAGSRYITSSTFSRRDTAQKWEAGDNAKFYEALSRFGTDFSLIAHVFPTRTRRQIKLKFKREERDYPQKVNQFLKSRTRMNVADTIKEFGLTGDAPPLTLVTKGPQPRPLLNEDGLVDTIVDDEIVLGVPCRDTADSEPVADPVVVDDANSAVPVPVLAAGDEQGVDNSDDEANEADAAAGADDAASDINTADADVAVANGDSEGNQYGDGAVVHEGDKADTGEDKSLDIDAPIATPVLAAAENDSDSNSDSDEDRAAETPVQKSAAPVPPQPPGADFAVVLEEDEEEQFYY
jgi:hypothetical protein